MKSDLRHIASADLLRQCAQSGQMDSRQVAAHERAGELNQSEGGITFVGPEPDDMPTPNLMLLATALVGLLSLFVIAGLFGWLAYWVWPVLVASI